MLDEKQQMWIPKDLVDQSFLAEYIIVYLLVSW